jgi:long-chain fatty acid transport protein
MTKLTPIVLVAGLGSVAHANGFLLNEFDAKAVGRGNATAATDVDPSSIYYNVGGLAAGPDGTTVSVGGSSITPIASFTDSTSGQKTDSLTPTQFIPGIFGSMKVTSMIGVGIGFYTPFGLAVKWPSSSVLAESAEEISLRTFFITPAVGLNLGSFVPGLSVGAGLDLVPATLELRQAILFGTDPPGQAHLGGTAFGIGGRLGVMYKPASMPQLSLGAMWRSPVKEDVSGNASFTVDPSTPQYRAMLPPDGTATTSLTLPQSVTVGGAYRPLDSLELEANIVWTNWSTFKNLGLVVPSVTGTGTMTINQVENFDNTWTVRLGGEYMLQPLGLAVRGGFIYDPTPVPPNHLVAQLPDIDRYDLTVGGSKSLGNYNVSLGLLWVLPQKRATASAPFTDPMNTPQQRGTYDVSAFVATLTVQGFFPKPQ